MLVLSPPMGKIDQAIHPFFQFLYLTLTVWLCIHQESHTRVGLGKIHRQVIAVPCGVTPGVAQGVRDQ